MAGLDDDLMHWTCTHSPVTVDSNGDHSMTEIGSLSADLIQDQPIAVTTLLGQHSDDGHGHCCTCTLGGQRGHSTWPCTIYAAATLAAARTPRGK